MSEPLRFALICEGKTDKIILEAALAAFMPHDFTVAMVQPEESLAFGHAGKFGGGWKGVVAKCRELRERGGVIAAGVLDNADVLLLHLDGEVAEEDEVACACPCPPASDTADALRGWIRGALGPSAGDPRIVTVVPMKETEAWLLPALRPAAPQNGPGLECRDKPSQLFAAGKPKLIASGQKKPARYLDQRASMTAGWDAVRNSLGEAQRFEHEVSQAVAHVAAREG